MFKILASSKSTKYLERALAKAEIRFQNKQITILFENTKKAELNLYLPKVQKILCENQYLGKIICKVGLKE